jgi:Methylamine utilisation protein MauE
MLQLDPVFIWVASAAAGTIFFASSLMKLRDVEIFRSAVINYRLLPQWAELPFSWAIPIAEGVSSLGMFFGPTRFWAAIALVALLCMFTLAILINILRGRDDIDCGCFGPVLRQKLSRWMLVRNAVVMMLVVTPLAAASDRPLGLLDVLTIVFATLVVIILYASANYLLANAPKLRALKELRA